MVFFLSSYLVFYFIYYDIVYLLLKCDLLGTGYVVYSWAYVMHIEQLTPDFLYSTGNTGPDFSEYFVEAPVFFKRNDIYYVLFGYVKIHLIL
jgi:hypothetical protein